MLLRRRRPGPRGDQDDRRPGLHPRRLGRPAPRRAAPNPSSSARSSPIATPTAGGPATGRPAPGASSTPTRSIRAAARRSTSKRTPAPGPISSPGARRSRRGPTSGRPGGAGTKSGCPRTPAIGRSPRSSSPTSPSDPPASSSRGGPSSTAIATGSSSSPASTPAGSPSCWRSPIPRSPSRIYDASFHNKLYAGRRRFITQYVNHFPLPSLASPAVSRLVELVARLTGGAVGPEERPSLEREVDGLVWESFGWLVKWASDEGEDERTSRRTSPAARCATRHSPLRHSIPVLSARSRRIA